MASQTDIKQLGTILGVWAHPDDETWSCAGIMAAAIDNGQKVACVTATKGSAGQTAEPQKWPDDEWSHIRDTEMGKALSIIGVHDLYRLKYKDGKLAVESQKQAVERLVRLIDKICPDTIMTFEPQGITGHSDHKAVSAWACAAVKQTKCQPTIYGACETQERYDKVGRKCDAVFDMYFNTDKPHLVTEKDADLTFRLPKERAQQKSAALKAYQSQYEHFFKEPLGRKYLKDLCAVECFIKLN